MTDQTDLGRMKRRRERLAMQLAKLDAQIAAGQGVYTGVVKETFSTSYRRETPLIRWQLDECLLCGLPGVATRYPGNPPSVCDACYEGPQIENVPSRAKDRTKKERKRRMEAGEPLPATAKCLSDE